MLTPSHDFSFREMVQARLLVASDLIVVESHHHMWQDSLILVHEKQNNNDKKNIHIYLSMFTADISIQSTFLVSI